MLFDPRRLLLIAGPCSLENEGVCRAAELNLVFKGSFDKANRTSLAGARGPRLEGGRA
ncbi:MAG: 3-deoxy-8-phosphooctulonate synthase, partial [Opitutaceae bacterium]